MGIQTVQKTVQGGSDVYKRTKFNISGATFRNTPHEWERWWNLGDGWYQIQVALTWNEGDGDVIFQINPLNSSGSQNVDGTAQSLIIGRRRVYKRLRI